MKLFVLGIGILVIIILLLFIYSALVVASEYDKLIEK